MASRTSVSEPPSSLLKKSSFSFKFLSILRFSVCGYLKTIDTASSRLALKPCAVREGGGRWYSQAHHNKICRLKWHALVGPFLTTKVVVSFEICITMVKRQKCRGIIVERSTSIRVKLFDDFGETAAV